MQPDLPSNAKPDPQPNVTIVISPRERFSHTSASLESLYAHTTVPFRLIYVDGGSPKPIQTYLEAESQRRPFKLIRTDRFLSPNQARNLGLQQVETDYVLFIDNDVEVAPGWLEALIACAEETQATLVCPLTCIGRPLHQKIHLAGGEARILTQVKKKRTRRKIHEKHYFVNRPVAEVQDQLHRQACEFAEFHCLLVRAEIFDQVGPLDEALLSTREHIDFCLTVLHAGGTVYCEPAAVVTYVPDPPRSAADLLYFSLRWSDAWEIQSLEHFCQKWDLDQDKYFKKRYNRLGHRRHVGILKPLARQITLGLPSHWLERALIPLERTLNHQITRRYGSSPEPQPSCRS